MIRTFPILIVVMALNSALGQSRIDRGKYTIFLPDTILLKDQFRTYHFEHKNDTIFYYEVWGGGEIDLSVIPIDCIERENLRLDLIEVENTKGERFSYYSTVVFIDDLTNKKCKCSSYEYPEEELEEEIEDEENMSEEEIFGIEEKKDLPKRKTRHKPKTRYKIVKGIETIIFIKSDNREIFDWLKTVVPYPQIRVIDD